MDDQILTLPSGGGAIQGMGERFAAEPFTGTGRFSVPIVVPPGRSGFQPQLELLYSTGQGNGPFGLGWHLNVPTVARKTSAGIPKYTDADTFTVAGGDDLIKTGEGQTEEGVRFEEHRPRTDSTFSRVRHILDGPAGYWEVTGRDGTQNIFGTDESSRVFDARTPSHTFAWLLAYTEDTFGNRVAYEYAHDDGWDTPDHKAHDWNQKYVSAIRYVECGSTSTEGDEFLYAVEFDYGDRDDAGNCVAPWDYRGRDAFSAYRAGFEIRTARRCRRIFVRLLPPNAPVGLIRTYSLDYRPAPGNATSLLQSISVTAYSDRGKWDTPGSTLEDGTVVTKHARVLSLPPLELDYTPFEPRAKEATPLANAGGSLPPRALDHPNFEVVDLDGQGLPGIVELTPTGQNYWSNVGSGQLGPRQPRIGPKGLSFADPNVRLADVDGDGRVELLISAGVHSGYYPASTAEGWDATGFVGYGRALPFDLSSPDVALVDIDGDGRIDALETADDEFRLYYNCGSHWADEVVRIRRGPADEFPDVKLSEAGGTVRLANVSGDGPHDIVRVVNGRVEYWPHMGHGRFGGRVTFENSPKFEGHFEESRVLLVDVDGDGYSDYVYVGNGRLTVWLNQAGKRWSDPIEVLGTPYATPTAVRAFDLLGTGTVGILWSDDGGGAGAESYEFLDLTGGAKPYLLRSICNNFGAATAIEYRPSTSYFLEDGESVPWRSQLPYPVQCVSRLTVEDKISGGTLVTEYHYSDGAWDPTEREFAGFGEVHQIESEELTSSEKLASTPPIRTKTWFHQGLIRVSDGSWQPSRVTRGWTGDAILVVDNPTEGLLDDYAALRALRGHVLRSETYAADGTDREARPYTVAETNYAVTSTGSGETAIHFGHPIAQRTTQWDRGEDPLTLIQFVDDYDDYGQPRTITRVACPRGWRSRDDHMREPFLATVTSTVYADTSSRYIVDRVASVATAEIEIDGALSLTDLLHQVKAGTGRKLVGETRTYYDDDPGAPRNGAFVGRRFGSVGKYGAPVRTAVLCFTSEVLSAAYGDAVPGYLLADAWDGDGYPKAFVDHMPEGAGYLREPDGASPRLYAQASRKLYDFHQDPSTARGLVLATRDETGSESVHTYDEFSLALTKLETPMGLTTEVRPEYRTGHASALVDPNGNRTHFTYSPIGRVAETIIEEAEANSAGFSPLAQPSEKISYDLHAFLERGEPISARTVRTYTQEEAKDDPGTPRTLTRVEFSDGFGRLIQTRVQAERDGTPPAADASKVRVEGNPSGPELSSAAVVVSGWQLFDGKGRVVAKYEPFFSSGFSYSRPSEKDLGERATLHYDAIGRLIRTVNPDGSERRLVAGTPIALDRPDVFDPTPWESFSYDENDLGAVQGPKASADQNHWNTPSSERVDALGRPVERIERIGVDESGWHVTRMTYDIRGNLTALTDANGHIAITYVHDLANRAARTTTLNGGDKTTIHDAAGRVVEARDARGGAVLTTYDSDGRRVGIWARAEAGVPITRAVRTEYGDATSAIAPDAARHYNALGRPYREFDEAGMVTHKRYDVRGNCVERERRVISDDVALARIEEGVIVDWDAHDGDVERVAREVLEPKPYTTQQCYDTLGHLSWVKTPRDVQGDAKTLAFEYNEAAALRSVHLETQPLVDQISYNARGQLVSLVAGSRLQMSNTYDRQTFRLKQSTIRSRGGAPEPAAERTVRDTTYQHDRVGNTVRIDVRGAGSGTRDRPDQMTRTFSYDALYRLVAASGRESAALQPLTPWQPQTRSEDARAAGVYRETYSYDATSNLVSLAHSVNGTKFTRKFMPERGTNRLKEVRIGAAAFEFGYDPNGNLIRETNSRFQVWDHFNRLVAHHTKAADTKSLSVRYLYSATGQVVKKVVREQGGALVSIVYIDGVFEAHRLSRPHGVTENSRYRVSTGDHALVEVRVGKPFPGDAGPGVAYHSLDLVGSSVLMLDAQGNTATQEEFSPFGETTFGGVPAKRYRFGARRSDESGFYRFGERWYAPWCGRWTSVDSVVPQTGAETHRFRPYAYAEGNPIRYRDQSGRWIESAWDAASLAVGIAMFIHDVREGNTVSAIVDAVGIVFDLVALALPAVPGGAGMAIRAERTAAAAASRLEHGAADALQAGRAVERVKEAPAVARQVEEVAAAGRAVEPGVATRAISAGRSGGRGGVPKELRGVTEQEIDAAVNVPGESTFMAQVATSKSGAAIQGTMDARSVHFTQNTASNTFGGVVLGEKDVLKVAEKLEANPSLAGEVSELNIVAIDGKLFSLDNRRLFAGQKADVALRYNWAVPGEFAKDDELTRLVKKYTTTNAGVGIEIKNLGTWIGFSLVK